MTGPGHQLSLLPGDQDETDRQFGPPPAATTPIATSGRTEYTAHCPRCDQTHRHTRPGPRRAPCGATYTITDHHDQEHDHAEEQAQAP